MATINFNANEVEPSSSFDAIPAGKYLAVITNSDEKKTKKGDGAYLQFEFEIVEGEYKNRRLWARLNMKNDNAETVRIARADLAAICRAVNVMQPRDTIELHNLPLTIVVKCRKNQDDEIVNEIKGYAPKASLSGAVSATPATTAPSNASGNSQPPWAR
jgi:hypothetical protein